MDVIHEGKHFRVVEDNELQSLLDTLQLYLPSSIKV